eukprot:g1397.t1
MDVFSRRDSSSKAAEPVEFPRWWDEDYEHLEQILLRLAHALGLEADNLSTKPLKEDLREKADLYQHFCSARVGARESTSRGSTRSSQSVASGASSSPMPPRCPGHRAHAAGRVVVADAVVRRSSDSESNENAKYVVSDEAKKDGCLHLKGATGRPVCDPSRGSEALGKVDLMLLHWPGDTASGTLQHGRPLPSCCLAADEAVQLPQGRGRQLRAT